MAKKKVPPAFMKAQGAKKSAKKAPFPPFAKKGAKKAKSSNTPKSKGRY